MRLVIQRVLEAGVSVGGQQISQIKQGMLILLGITPGDNSETVKKYVNKVLKLRIWPEIVKKPAQEPKEKTDGETDKKEEEKVSDTSSENSTPGRAPKTWDSNVVDNGFEILVVSQFTLYGILKGNKPDFHLAMNPDDAIKLYDEFVNLLKSSYKPEKIQTGKFGEYMHVNLVNDGPVTLIIDSEKDK